MAESKSAGYAAVKAEVDVDTQPGLDDAKAARRDKRIKILRIIQSILSALLSIAIAIFQGRVYWTYQNTKDMPGAWPTVPNLVPTILLFSVAIVALVFDSCMLVAYLRPASKFTPWAIRIGDAAHYIVASAKTVSYAISAVISKTATTSATPQARLLTCGATPALSRLRRLSLSRRSQTATRSLHHGRSRSANWASKSSAGLLPSSFFDGRRS